MFEIFHQDFDVRVCFLLVFVSFSVLLPFFFLDHATGCDFLLMCARSSTLLERRSVKNKQQPVEDSTRGVKENVTEFGIVLDLLINAHIHACITRTTFDNDSPPLSSLSSRWRNNIRHFLKKFGVQNHEIKKFNNEQF